MYVLIVSLMVDERYSAENLELKLEQIPENWTIEKDDIRHALNVMDRMHKTNSQERTRWTAKRIEGNSDNV
uniref:Uncharacterized protein n=1 Tax=Romanomermis culicivorax TaxID=13658 RepID=A0A915LAD7_ROMCU